MNVKFDDSYECDARNFKSKITQLFSIFKTKKLNET